MFKGFGYFAMFVFIVVASQIGSVGPGFAIYFISLLLVVSGVLGFSLLQLPVNLDQEKIKSLLSFEKHDLKTVLVEITDLATIIRRDGLLVAEAHRKNLKDKKLQYLVKRAMDGFERPQLMGWVESQQTYLLAQFDVLQKFFDRTLLIFPVIGIMGSVCSMMRPSIVLESALVPFLVSLFLQLLIQSLFQERITEARRRCEAYFALLKEGVAGMKEGIASEFINEQLSARLGILP